MPLMRINNPLEELDDKLNDNLNEMLPEKSLLKPTCDLGDHQENKLLIL